MGEELRRCAGGMEGKAQKTGQTRFKRTGPTTGSRVEEIERREVDREAEAGDA